MYPWKSLSGISLTWDEDENLQTSSPADSGPAKTRMKLYGISINL